MHSWAFDGLRAKKWNVSCEPYGRRWHHGDVVGALLDTDLLEMRFFLNGEDLGPAFSNFGSTDLYPAISLNVRQSVRVNFGQYSFIYPPDEIDGKAFRPVSAALNRLSGLVGSRSVGRMKPPTSNSSPDKSKSVSASSASPSMGNSNSPMPLMGSPMIAGSVTSSPMAGTPILGTPGGTPRANLDRRESRSGPRLLTARVGTPPMGALVSGSAAAVAVARALAMSEDNSMQREGGGRMTLTDGIDAEAGARAADAVGTGSTTALAAPSPLFDIARMVSADASSSATAATATAAAEVTSTSDEFEDSCESPVSCCHNNCSSN